MRTLFQSLNSDTICGASNIHVYMKTYNSHMLRSHPKFKRDFDIQYDSRSSFFAPFYQYKIIFLIITQLFYFHNILIYFIWFERSFYLMSKIRSSTYNGESISAVPAITTPPHIAHTNGQYGGTLTPGLVCQAWIIVQVNINLSLGRS